MIRCQECESEVSENDAFCPYCGISLQFSPVPVEAVIVDAPEADLDSTIMMAPADAESLVLGDISIGNPETEVFPETSETKVADSSDDPIVQDPTGEDLDSTEPEEVPVPSILSDLVATEEKSLPEVSAEIHSSEEAVLDERTPDPVDPSDASSAIDGTVETPVTEGVAGTDADLADVADLAAPNTDLSVDAESESASENVIEEKSDAEVVSDDGSQLTYEASSAVDEADIPLNNVDDAIQMPFDELDEHDPFKNGSTFDSVRIMENQIPYLIEEAEQKPLVNSSVDEPVEAQPKESKVSGELAVQNTGSTSVTTGDNDTDGKKAAKLKPLQEGTILNSRYEIVRKIGGGGMGAVYLASDNNLGGVLRAVKEMVQSHIEEEQQEKAINDFKRESMILSTLDHIAIPTIFDYFYDADEGRFYLVMKYISGGDLSSRLRSAPEGKLDEQTVVEWAIQIADVLDYLHSQPSTIVYRDLKPSNIMVDGNTGRIMLIDFGIARSINQKEEKGVTAVGTMGYAPPELFSGNVEPRSDIYSLGSTIFHLLTGADPQSNPLLIFDFQKNPRPRQINPQLSDQIERIMMKSVEYNASSRFSSAAELKHVLEEHLNSLKSGSMTYGVSEAPAPVSLANQQVFCGFCGQRIVATDLFCAFCGSKQPIAQQGVHSDIYSKNAVSARLFVEGTGELSTPTFSLTKDENLVGRRDPMSNIFPEVDLSKYDPQTKISRRHARIWRNGARFVLEDLGSSNGTLIDGAANNLLRLTPHTPHPLTNGDKIKIGDTTLHFVQG